MKVYLGFRSATAADLDQVCDWLANEALVQDRPIVLFHLACERMTQCRLVRPDLTVIEQSPKRLLGSTKCADAARDRQSQAVGGEMHRLLTGDLAQATAAAFHQAAELAGTRARVFCIPPILVRIR